MFRLLLGVDEEKKEIVCGLVDTIGWSDHQKSVAILLIDIDCFQGVLLLRKPWNIKRNMGFILERKLLWCLPRNIRNDSLVHWRGISLLVQVSISLARIGQC